MKTARTERAASTTPRPLREKLGVCQWFHYEDHAQVERAITFMHELGVEHLRTGISWADFHRPRGRAWCDWQMKALKDFDVLLSIWHTPPSLAEGGACNAPPRRLQDYADFIWLVTERYDGYFTHLELWNEPNNRMKWDFHRFDPDWSKFARMIAMAGNTARMQGAPTVLGGMIPVDVDWLNLMERHGALEQVDDIAMHAFPEMWWPQGQCWDWHSHWHGWDEKISKISRTAPGKRVWVTETGLATWDMQDRHPARFALQARMLKEAAAAPAHRVYWYSLIDLDPRREAIEGFHVDENEYHMGLVTWEGERKPAFYEMQDMLALRPTSRAGRAGDAAS